MLSFENSTACIITSDDISHTVQKGDIATVNGKGFSIDMELKSYTATLPVALPVVQPTDTATFYQGKKIAITLKNGMVFNGTVISDKGRMLLLDRDGAPVNLYKSTIARVEVIGETPVKNEVPGSVKTDGFLPHAENDNVNKPVVSVSRFDDDPEQIASLSTLKSEQLAEPQPSADVTSRKSMETVAAVSVNRVDSSRLVKNVQNVQPVDSSNKKNNTGKQSAVQFESKNQPVSAVQTPHIPENVYFPSIAKSNNGKRTIILKNGTVFTGTIQSEDERFLIINSEGTSLNILKKVIKTIDGQVYRSAAPVKPPSVSQVPQSVTLKAQKEIFSGKRHYPSISVPSEVTTAMLLDSLKSPVWERRSRACRMLGAMGDWAYSAVPVIARVLSDTAQSRLIVPVWIDSSDVQRLLAPSLEAARALAYLGESGYQVLIDGLSSADFLVRRSAVFGLLEFIGDKQKTEVLFKMLKDKDASVRAVALGAFCTETGEKLLIDALRDSETVIRCNAALLLGKMKSEHAVKDLENLIADNRSLVRVYAVEAIGAIGSVNASRKIVNLLKDPNFLVREKTAEALGYLGDTISIVPLINALRDVNPDVRGAAAAALSFIRDPRAIPSLYALLKDENSAVREKARNSLRLHTELKQLIDGLNDPSTTVRDNSSYVLWLLTGKDFGNDPEKWKQWYAEQGKKKLPLK